MNLVYYSAVSTADYQTDERVSVAHLRNLPSVGDRLGLGNSQRLWTVVAMDHYQPVDGVGDGLWLAHCDLQLGRDRSQWFSVQQMTKRKAPTLWLYLGHDALIQQAVNYVGRSPVIGKLIPRYNTTDHTVDAWPWGVERVTTYVPSEGLELPCYRSVKLAHCVYVPEFAAADEEVTQPLAMAG